MKALSILGTSSNSGKSWLATAFCALLKRRGMRVAPFKAQNMSNNSHATFDGAEIGRAQAAQAEACGLVPCWEMNPILLKPSGGSRSQVLVRGKAGIHKTAREYFENIEDYWDVVRATLDDWGTRWEALVFEGAGSPVELNLMDRDIANLRPISYVDGRWILCADIERGGVFAQIVGTWNLIPEALKKSCLGIVVNKFRGDLSLFADASRCLEPHVPVPLLGTLPYCSDLQPEPEDSLALKREFGDPDGAIIAWIKLPYLSNSTDAEPFTDDRGVQIRWVDEPDGLKGVSAIVIPGSKDTLADLKWLYESGIAEVVASADIPIVGICGGYQMLGRTLRDTTGAAGQIGELGGLGLLPVDTEFGEEKRVTQVEVGFPESDELWDGYEIHMGQTHSDEVCPLLRSGSRDEGARVGKVWGTYVHGLFDHPVSRRALCELAGIQNYVSAEVGWMERKRKLYEEMADLLDEHLDLAPVFAYLDGNDS